MTLLKLSTLIFLCLCLPSCVTHHKYNGEVKEAVLREGMRIHFKNKNGEGSISYVSPNERTFTFDGHSQTIKMIPRPERFLGQLGIYNPAETWFSSAQRIVASEAERHFDSEKEALTQLVEGSAVMNWVYNREGYVVGFSRTPSRFQTNVDVYRYFIRGKPARFLRGFSDENVIVKE